MAQRVPTAWEEEKGNLGEEEKGNGSPFRAVHGLSKTGHLPPASTTPPQLPRKRQNLTP